jgi:hypothetical protein
MPPIELQQLLRRQPFAPFRIYMADGSSYDVRRMEMCMVGLATATVGFPSSADSTLYDRTMILSLRQVVRVEPLEGAVVTGSNGPVV